MKKIMLGLGAALFLGSASQGWCAQLAVTPVALSNQTWQGLTPSSQTFEIYQSSGNATVFNYSVSSSAGWLSIVPANGSFAGGPQGSASVTVNYATKSLATGAYVGTISIEAPEADNTPVTLPVALRVQPSHRVYGVEPATQHVTVVYGSTNQAQCTLAVWNAATPGLAQPLSWTLMPAASWIEARDPSGSSTGTQVVHTLVLTNFALLYVGTYTGRVDVYNAGMPASNSPVAATVVLSIIETPPELGLSTNRISLVVTQGVWVADRSLQVLNRGDGWLPFDATNYSPWLTVSPHQGSTHMEQPETLACHFSVQSLLPGTYTDSIKVAPPGSTDDDDAEYCSISVVVRPYPYSLAVTGSLAGTVTAGSGASLVQTMQVWNCGSDLAMTYDASAGVMAGEPQWLEISPETATCGQSRVTHQVTMSAADLQEGAHEGWITIMAFDAPNSPLSTTVFFYVASDIRVTPTPIICQVPEHGLASNVTVGIWNAGSTNRVYYTITGDSFWFECDSPGGDSAGETNFVTLSFDTTGLHPGVYRGALRVVGTHQTLDVPVLLQVGTVMGEFEERLVFSAKLDGRPDQDIWSIRPDGSDRRLLYGKTGDQYAPRVSFDGTQVVFEEPAASRIMAYDLISGEETALDTFDPCSWLNPSNDLVQARLVYGRGAYLTRRILDGGLDNLFNAPGELFEVIGADQAGQYLFYTRRPVGGRADSLRSLRLDTRAQQTLLPQTAGVRTWGDVAPGGNALCYTYQAPSGGRRQSLRELTQGRGERELAAAGDEQFLGAVYRPDGEQVVSLATRDSNGARRLVNIRRADGQRTTIFSAASDSLMSPPDCAMLFAANPVLWLSTGVFSNYVPLLMDGSLTNALGIRNTGNSVMIWSVTSDVEWIYFSADSGTSTGETDTLKVYVKPYALPDGIFTGRVTVTANSTNSPGVVTVVANVNQRPPVIAMMAELAAAADLNGSPAVLDVPVWNDGDSRFSYTATTNRSWMRLLQWSGTVSNNVSNVRLACSPTGLAAGTYTGQVMVVGDNSRQTNRTAIIFDVVAPLPVIPRPAANPTNLTPSTYRYEPTARQYVTISNTASSGILNYYATDNASWLEVFPSSSATNQRGFTRQAALQIWYTTTNLAQGTHTAAITVHGSNGTAVVQVAMTVLAPRQFTLTIPAVTGGGVLRAPDQAGYTYGSPVLLIATNLPGYYFKSWKGPTSSARSQVATVTVNSNITVTPEFVERNRIYGRVTNTLLGTGIKNVNVLCGDRVCTTDISGWYEAYLPATNHIFFTCGRKGYTPTEPWGVIDLHAGANRRDVGLRPSAIKNLKAYQPDGTRDVVISYELLGETNDVFTVALSMSGNRGQSWTIGLTNVSGDVGYNVKPGAYRKIHWDAGRDFDMQECYGMVARLQARGQSVTSSTFALLTVGADNWKVAAYLDYNSNGQYDPGEILANMPFYIGQRTYANVTSGADGIAAINSAILHSEKVFARQQITTRPAVKDHHGVVDDIMWTLWMDSDEGRDDNNWTGQWKAYRLDSDDIARARRGDVVYVKLGHPVFEWNLTFDAYAPVDDDYLRNMRAGLGRASEYLYCITHGQMKLGKLFISSPDHDLRREDVVVIPESGTSATYANAIESGESSDDIDLYMEDLGWNNAASNTYSAFGRTLIHEFGHYGLNFRDEYEPATGGDSVDTNWGWNANYPDLFPRNYGTMQGQSANHLSSANDYIQDYNDYVPDGYSANDPPSYNDLARWVSEHYFHRGYRACWEYLKARFDQSYSFGGKVVPVRLIGQRPGVFANGKSSSNDRDSSFDIPRPYSVCRVKIDDGPWQGPYDVGGPGRRLASGMGRLQFVVLDQGAPAAGARVALRRAADGRLLSAGRTDARGQALLLDWAPGDTLELFRNGQRLTQVLAADTPRPLTLDFEAATRHAAQWPLATNRLGLVLSGSLMGLSNYTFSLRSSVPLAGLPAVVVHFDEGGSSTVTMQNVSMDARAFQGNVELADRRGLFEISCVASNGQTLDTLDNYLVIAVSATNSVSGPAIHPGIYAEQLETIGLIYQANGPVILPGGAGQPPTNQVGPALHFTMLSAPVDSSNSVGATIRFDLAALHGVDLVSASTWQWDDFALTWLETPGHLVPLESSYTVTLTNGGVVAFFAPNSSDTNPPASITDLVALTGDDPFTVHLQWTAPGSDGTNGQALAYDLRYSTTETDWSNATPAYLAVAPAAAGSAESASLVLPQAGTFYYFGMRALDQAGNYARSNNVTSAMSGLDDANGDGISDAWLADAEAAAGGVTIAPDDDLDNDGRTTYDEFNDNTDPNNWDTDGDEMSDGYEVENNLDPLNADDRDLDPDGDGLTNQEESALDTNPQSADTDGDGMPDPWEVEMGLDPKTTANYNGADDDPDADTFDNHQEYGADTQPTNAASYLHIQTMNRGQLLFESSPRRQYQVHGTTNLWRAPWQPVQNLSGTGGVQTVTVTNSQGVGFYSIGAEYP